MYRSQRVRIDDIHALFCNLIFVDVEVTGRVLRAAAPNFHAPTLLQKKKNKRNVDRYKEKRKRKLFSCKFFL